MVPRAASWLVQNPGSACLASSASRAAVFPGMSKRVPQLGEPGAQFVGPPPEVRVHRVVLHRERAAGGPPTGFDSSIAKRVRGPKPTDRGPWAFRGRSMSKLAGKVAV